MTIIRFRSVWSVAHLVLLALLLIVPGRALIAADDEPELVVDDYYEPFDPAAPALQFKERQLPEIEYYSAKTLQNEVLKVDPALFEPANGLEFYMFSIGQADAMLVVGPGPERRSLLVDLGVSREKEFSGRYSVQLVGQRLIDILGKRKIDYFLLSHFHSDHMGSGDSGITALIAHGGFTVGTMIDTGTEGSQYVSRAQSATDLIAMQDVWLHDGRVGKVEHPRFGTGQIKLGNGVSVEIMAFAGKYAPGKESVHAAYERHHPAHYASEPASENDLSIALEISLGNFEFWTGGDLSGASGDGTAELSGSRLDYTNVEWPMVQYWRAKNLERDVEVFRANHHGSGYSNTSQLLGALDPEVILYSARSGYGHPSLPAVQRGSQTAVAYATSLDPGPWTEKKFADEHGTVAGEIHLFVASDGASYTVNGKRFRAFSDAEERNGVDSSQ